MAIELGFDTARLPNTLQALAARQFKSNTQRVICDDGVYFNSNNGYFEPTFLANPHPGWYSKGSSVLEMSQ